jgi:hypothetical protein
MLFLLQARCWLWLRFSPEEIEEAMVLGRGLSLRNASAPLCFVLHIRPDIWFRTVGSDSAS